MPGQDGLHRRGLTWYFGYRGDDGRWHERSTSTENYQQAKAARETFLGQLKLAGVDRLRWSFKRAGEFYRVRRAADGLAPATLRLLDERLVPLNAALGALRLEEITAPILVAYKAARKAKVKPRTFNMERSVIRAILEDAGLWARLEREFTPMKEPDSIGKALETHEIQKLYAIGERDNRWTFILQAALFAANTGLRGKELKTLWLSDIRLREREVRIRRAGTKTDAGARIVPLNEEAMKAAEFLLLRAAALGCTRAEHYLFPANRARRGETGLRGTDVYDPTHPQKTFRTTWRAFVTECGLKGLRFHDLRHTFRSDLADQNTDRETAKELMGWTSNALDKVYEHMRSEAKERREKSKREAVNSISRKPMQIVEVAKEAKAE